MGENLVKGTMLIDYARLIRANKDRNWSKYLEPEDMEIIKGKIFSSVWYHYKSFERIGMAVFHEIAGSNIETARVFGRFFWKNLLTGVYRTILSDRDPYRCLERYAILREQFFNFATHEIKKLGDKHVHSIITLGEMSPGLEPFCAQLAGGFDTIMESADCQNPRVEIIQKEWEGAPATIYDISWE